MKAEPIWETVVNDLEPIGCGVGTVNNAYEFQLVERLRVTQLPSIVFVFDSRILYYAQTHIDRKSLVEFARNSLPSDLVHYIDDENFDSFIDKAQTRNQVTVLMFSVRSESPRLRFILTAAAYRSYASFGFVSPKANAGNLLSKFGLLKSNNEAMIILLEQKWKPVATLNMDEIPTDSMRDTIERYKYLSVSVYLNPKKFSALRAEQSFVQFWTKPVKNFLLCKFLFVMTKFTLLVCPCHVSPSQMSCEREYVPRPSARLPRLSSQLHFDELCPISTSHDVKICAILIVADDQEPSDRLCISAFRNYAISRSRKVPSGSSLKLTYVFKRKQLNFVSSLETAIEENGETRTILQRPSFEQNARSSVDARSLFLIRRLSRAKARVRLIQYAWDASSDDRLNASIEIFERELRRWLSSRGDQSSFEARLRELIDENGPGLYKRLASKFVQSVETAWLQLTRHEAMPMLSVFGTLMAIMGIGWCLNYAVESERNAEKQAEATQDRGKPIEQKQEFKRLIREMRAGTYFGMVRLLKPGFRSLVVLCDENSKNSLVNQFAKAIWPWRKNHSLLFGFVMVDKNLHWYRQLLRSAVLCQEDEQHSTFGLEIINPKNVVGTVLALNGFRQYFCIYHPKYAPSLEGYGHKASRKQCKNGSFLGFDDDENFGLSDEENDSDSEREAEQMRQKILNKKSLNLDELLDGLPNWLDRLFEGSSRRYYVQQWPKEMR
uniref:Uncharacterized protein n=1 Tax=Romanomermis culicivorax TaxID=13658 RepID=A0A915KJ04_ROMCU